MDTKRFLTMTVAGLLAAVLAFDLVGFRETSFLSFIPYVLDMLTLVFHEAGRMITGWVFINLHDHVDLSGLFRLVEPVPYIGWLLVILVCLAPLFLYHLIAHRLLAGDLAGYLSGPWLRIGVFFLYVVYLVMFFAVPPAVMGEVGGFIAEMVVAYVLLARGVSGRARETQPGEVFLHFMCGFYILFSMIYMFSLVVRGVPAEIEKLVILEGLAQSMAGTLSFYGVSVGMVDVAWALLALTVALLIAPFVPMGHPFWAFLGRHLKRLIRFNSLMIFENLKRKPVRPGPPPRRSVGASIENGDIFEPNPNDFKGL